MSETPDLPTSAEQPSFCLRCPAVQLLVLQPGAEIMFFACPRCRREYARQPGAALVYRWGNPLSLALYGVIFESDALPHATRIARHLARDTNVEQIEQLVREIELELEAPTQPVTEILPMAAPKSEEHLREFLRLVARHLRQANERQEQSSGSR